MERIIDFHYNNGYKNCLNNKKKCSKKDITPNQSTINKTMKKNHSIMYLHINKVSKEELTGKLIKFRWNGSQDKKAGKCASI